MSEMSQAQGPVCAYVDVDPTDDMVPPGAQSLRDPTLGTLVPRMLVPRISALRTIGPRCRRSGLQRIVCIRPDAGIAGNGAPDFQMR
jgi:hypothetical protein